MCSVCQRILVFSTLLWMVYTIDKEEALTFQFIEDYFTLHLCPPTCSALLGSFVTQFATWLYATAQQRHCKNPEKLLRFPEICTFTIYMWNPGIAVIFMLDFLGMKDASYIHIYNKLVLIWGFNNRLRFLQQGKGKCMTTVADVGSGEARCQFMEVHFRQKWKAPIKQIHTTNFFYCMHVNCVQRA